MEGIKIIDSIDILGVAGWQVILILMPFFISAVIYFIKEK
jgi:hypothetical protein